MLKVIGQRWLLTVPKERVIAEIAADGTAKVIQILDSSGPYIIGDTMNIDMSRGIWEYLSGQDKPRD
jgi:hypothetical protein